MLLLVIMTVLFFAASVYYTDPFDYERNKLADRFTVATIMCGLGIWLAWVLS